jgi:UDP-glucose:(heptosyl)LPS alpha-1,3-glucosyltransferase
MARELAVEERVQFVGHLSDPSGYFAAADAFLLPTAYEAFPLVLLEAAASGVPVLATRVNGANSFIDEGVNGFFVDRNGESISTTLNVLTAMGAEKRHQIGLAARESTLAFSWDRIVCAHTDLYASLWGESDVHGQP